MGNGRKSSRISAVSRKKKRVARVALMAFKNRHARHGPSVSAPSLPAWRPAMKRAPETVGSWSSMQRRSQVWQRGMKQVKRNRRADKRRLKNRRSPYPQLYFSDRMHYPAKRWTAGICPFGPLDDWLKNHQPVNLSSRKRRAKAGGFRYGPFDSFRGLPSNCFTPYKRN